MKHTPNTNRPSENHNTANTQHQNRPSETPSKKPAHKKAWLKGILLALVLALLVLIGMLTWMVTTPSGLRFGLYKMPAWFGVHIQSKTLNGTLLDGFDGSDWQINTSGANINISNILFTWQPKQLLQKHLHINRIAVGNIHIISKPTPPSETSQPQLPTSVDLPINIDIDSLEFGQITLGKDNTLLLQQGQVAYHYAKGKNHHLTLSNIKSPWSTSNGQATLGLTSPFALQGNIDSIGILDKLPVENHIHLSGSLRDIHTSIDLTSQKTVLKAQSALHPFAIKLNDKIDNIQIKGQSVNPRAFLASLPKADLDFDAIVVPSLNKGLALEGSIDLANHAAAPADSDGIPMRTLLADFNINENALITIKTVHAELLKKGMLQLNGNIDTSQQQLNLNLLLKNLTAPDLLTQTFAGKLNGHINLKGSYQAHEAQWKLNTDTASSDGTLHLTSDTKLGQQTLTLDKARILPNGGGEMSLKGTLELFKDKALTLIAQSQNFNPAKLNPALPTGNVNGHINLDGALGKGIFNGKMNFAPSTLSGVPLKGSADIVYEKEHLSRALSNIMLGANSIQTNGSFGKKGDRLNLNIHAPDLSRFGFGLRGLVNAQGYIAGEPKQLEANVIGQARNFHFQKIMSVNSLDFKLQGSPNYNAPLNIELKGDHINIPGKTQPTVIDAVNLFINGTAHQHTIRGNSSIGLDGKHYKLNINAAGGLNEQNQWKGNVSQLDINGAFNLKLQNRMTLEAGTDRVSMSSTNWAAMGGSLNMQNFMWDKKNGIVSKGSASNLHMQELHNFYTPPLKHDLVLSGDWDLSYSQNMRGYLNIRRQSGDIILDDRGQKLGLGNFTINTRFQNGRINTAVDGLTAYGKVNGNIIINQQFGNDITQAPLNGHIRINANDLTRFKNFLPIGHTLSGNVVGEANISGKVGMPQLTGTINGNNLYYRNSELGLILDNGSLRSHLQGQRWHIDSLRFQHGGTIELQGDIGLVNGTPDVNVTAHFNQYKTLDRPSRRLILSGDARMLYTEANGITLTGQLKADSAQFGMQQGSMPTLSDDVVVLGEEPKKKTTSTAIAMNLMLDLNNAVRFVSSGIDVTLGGKLNLIAKPGQDVQGVGTVDIIKGQYKAYGQDLKIIKGSISFVGPLGNPNINIRAERNLSPVGAGVEVLGNLNNPRITLVTNEPMSEKDKLSWLLLNRASSGSSSDEAALSAAAGAFLAGQLNDRIGLVDDFGFTSQQTRNAQTGELNPAEQVLTVGKQLSQNLYLGYEYGLNSASQSVKLIYQLTHALQAIARVGTMSWGGELKYTIRFD